MNHMENVSTSDGSPKQTKQNKKEKEIQYNL
jgi:hypothetical protein